ncbi:MAG: hypothetical protein ABI969_06670 [bacterium]
MFQQIATRLRALARRRKVAVFPATTIAGLGDDESVVDRTQLLEMAVVA